MEEALLHFIWRYQKFNSREFVTDEGQQVLIFHPGTPNADAGPDFTISRSAWVKIVEASALLLLVSGS